ncbi:hypothetical protein [Piscinibacter gummiphilus]|uniref:DUF4136 domain-containing protein n=1 Tax=Piscinibacter gummiphilus TaxID=946333 RepID=A0A1W6LD48_9BURK|nr:hypothetical protein [Piscinibacter gummiphilus]ARN22205.1 hypothetical protein A4W93_21160 [Piscinibacter gummiphilus]ATU66894.1 hypothetical protein CPZ87_21260 [Piscinibacter gummiphilus]GLS94305.1 hypothetical protein GCM10007918_15970 [Piscinibacter gummiphilus]
MHARLRFPSSRWLALAFGLLLTACATYSLTNVWRDPGFQGPPLRKVLVLAMSGSDANRRIFEDGVAQALRAAGTEATPAYTLLADSGHIPPEKIKAALSRSGAEAVLITRLLKVDRQVNVSPAGPAPMMYGRGGFYGWYGGAWGGVPATIDTYNVLTLETTLWDMRADKALWTATSEGTEVRDMNKATADLSKALVERMKQDGVI